MKILLVSDYASSFGGAEVQTRLLRDELRLRNHDARVLATGLRSSRDDNFADYRCFGTTSRFRTLLQAFNPWAQARLRQVLAEFRPDVVHVRMFLTQLSPAILPLLRDVPSLYNVTWYRPVCPLGTKVLPDETECHDRAGIACYRHGCLPLRDFVPLAVQMSLWRRWRDVFDLVVANSEASRQHLLAEGVGPVQVLWNGVPAVGARPPLAGPPVVAFAGRLVRQKGVDVLVRAFAEVVARVPEARLELAGEGPEQASLRRLVDDLGLSPSVAMLGYLPRPELERRQARAWVQAVPARWAESFGLAAAEAMMRGTAVVASRTGGLPEFIRDGETGLLVPPGDARALADALLALLGDRARAEQMGRRGRELALSELSDRAWVDRFVELYEGLRDRGVQSRPTSR